MAGKKINPINTNDNLPAALSAKAAGKIKRNKTLIFNFTSLSILQICNYIFPFITLPYLVRVLGPERFGFVNFIIAFTGYFGIITDYGFNLSGTQSISVNRDDKTQLNKTFSSILLIKLMLFAACSIIFIICLFCINRFAEDWLAYSAGFLSVFGSVLFPVWLFMGLEKMKYVSIINITVKLLFTISIFVLIINRSHSVLYLFIYSLHLIIIGLMGIYVSIVNLKLKFVWPSKAELIFHMKEGWYVFLSTFSISLYTISNTFILGLFASNEVVGYFSAADKIRSAVQGFFSSASQAVYPHLSSLFVQSRQAALSFVKKFFYIIVCLGSIASILTMIFAEKIVIIFLGTQYRESVVLLQIISFLPLIIMIGNVFGVQTLLNAGYKKAFSKILAISAAVNIVISFVFVPKYLALGTSIIVMIVESFVTLGFYFQLNKNNIHIFRKSHV
jgi:PST family polysaccharide transporter